RPLVTGELRVAAEVIHRAERNGHQDRAHAGAVGRRRGEVIPLPGGEGADEQPDGEHHQEHAHGHLRTPGREAVTGPSPATFSVIPARAASRKPRPRPLHTTPCSPPGPPPALSRAKPSFLLFRFIFPFF